MESDNWFGNTTNMTSDEAIILNFQQGVIEWYLNVVHVIQGVPKKHETWGLLTDTFKRIKSPSIKRSTENLV